MQSTTQPRPLAYRMRIMRYTHPDRSQAQQILPDGWYAGQENKMPHYAQSLKLAIPHEHDKPQPYVIASPPLVIRVETPEQPGRRVPILLVYVVPQSEWVLYKDLTVDELAADIYPRP